MKYKRANHSIKYFILLFLILWIFTPFSSGEENRPVTINEFNSRIFWEKDKQGMIELDLFFSNVTDSLLIVAVGDMDGDKYTDIVTINNERNAFRVFLYDNKLKRYVFGEKEFPANCMIANIQTLKTTPQNGGLLVTWSKPNSVMKVYIYDDDIHDFAEATERQIPIKRGNQPFITDLNGDFYPDILFEDNEGIKIAFQNGHSDTVIKRFDDFVQTKAVGGHQWLSPDSSRHLASPGAVGYADIDGDCVADLLLTTIDSYGQAYLEIYVSLLGNFEYSETEFNFATRYWLVKKAPLPDGIDPVLLFADFDREGMIDVLGFSTKTKSIYLFKNGLIPRSTDAKGLCYSENHLDQDGEVFPGLDGSLSIKPNEHVMINKIHGIPYFKNLHGHTEVFPPRLRFGDINADGYPDLIATFELSGHNAFAAVLTNTACDDVKDINCKKGDRIFVYNEKKYNEALRKHNDWNYAFFFDIEENGILDIILVVHDVNQRKDKIIPLMTNYDQDSFFLKTKVVRHMEAKNDVVLSGATIRAAFTQLGDEKYILVGTQRSQESYANLGVSYAYFGIGRSNNYIEAFTLGAIVFGKKVVRSWTPIIPNTQLIISTQNTQNANHWQLDLLIGPTKAIGILVVVVLLFLLIIGLLIMVMHFAEKAEDEKEKTRAFDFL